MIRLTMKVLPHKFAVCKLKATSKIPSFLLEESFVSITRTQDELSIVCHEGTLSDYINDFGKAEVYPNWSGLMVIGPLDFSLIGILSKITQILADAQVSVFALSTFDTDYIYVQNDKLDIAIKSLEDHDITILT